MAAAGRYQLNYSTGACWLSIFFFIECVGSKSPLSHAEGAFGSQKAILHIVLDCGTREGEKICASSCQMTYVSGNMGTDSELEIYLFC